MVARRLRVPLFAACLATSACTKEATPPTSPGLGAGSAAPLVTPSAPSESAPSETADDTVAPALGADEAAALEAVHASNHRPAAEHPESRSPIRYGATGGDLRSALHAGSRADGDVAPRVRASATTSVPDGVSEAGRLQVARWRPALRRCYGKALLSDPTLAGSLSIEVVRGADGAVVQAKATAKSGGPFPGSFIACIETMSDAARSGPPASPETYTFTLAVSPW